MSRSSVEGGGGELGGGWGDTFVGYITYDVHHHAALSM